ncbi:MAG: hypothetical protein IPJ61_11030 [Tessaracoccus sp.]|uniref:hypothetical protein n=1 Tax=Tessaracoccus sp. TaxID=1971211 RepID=UPI001ECB27DB|nr:hypothetical protein [Tessaracoccus sp.]MBK7821580.1 hypothetical protein [Tessaracoccus sp.]
MVIVRGATLSAMAAAARLSRLGHDVTLVTEGETLGDGCSDDGPLLLPAAWRDLFKKSGAHLVTALNAEGLELVSAPPAEHPLPDGTTFALPSERGAQYHAVAAAFGADEAARWRDLIDDLDEVWAAFRRHALEGTAPVETAPQRSALWLDRTVGEIADRLRGPLATRVLALVEVPEAPALLALPLSVERTFGRWQLTDAEGKPQPSTRLVGLLAERLAERGVRIVDQAESAVDIDAVPPAGWRARTASAEDWLGRVPIVGADGVLRASGASPAGPAPWAQLGSAALAVYALHERLTGEDPRPTNKEFTLPRLPRG